MKPSHPSHFIGLTNRIASVLFATIPALRADPFSDPLDRCHLFTGNPGTGKSSLALALAAEITGEPIERLWRKQGFNVEQLNGQSLTIEVVRQWVTDGRYIPLNGIRVQIVDEIDAGSTAAFGALRSYLDQLPSHTLFIATTNRAPEDLQPQLHSRCQLWRFQPVAPELIAAHLTERLGIDSEAAHTYASHSGGNVRAALLDAKAHVRTTAVMGLQTLRANFVAGVNHPA